MAKKSKTLPVPDNRTSSALRNLVAWVDEFPQAFRSIGADLHRNHHVVELDGSVDHLVQGLVHDEEGDFEVALFCTQGRWSSGCQCEDAPECPHSAAVALAWLAKHAGTLAEDPAKPREKPRPFAEVHGPIVAEKLARPLRAEETRALTNLEQLHGEVLRRHGRLIQSSLHFYGFGWFTDKPPSDWEIALEGWWNPTQPPATPLDLWQYLAYDLERRGAAIPEVYRPLTDTGAVRARLEGRLLEQSLNRWQFALQQALEPAESSSRDSGSEPLDGVRGLRVIVQQDGLMKLQTRRGADAPWKQPSGNFLRYLPETKLSQLQDFSPAEAALARTLILALQRRDRLTTKEPLPEGIVDELLASRDTHPALFLPGERPFTIEEESLTAAALPEDGNASVFRLQLVLPDGRIAVNAHHLGGKKPALYLHESRVWRGPRPMPEGLMPVQALETPAIVQQLRQLKVTLPEKIRSNLRHVAMRPELECSLEGGPFDDGQSDLKVRLLAVADDPRCAQEWRGYAGWQWDEARTPPARRAGDPMLEFDLSAANRIGATFGGFRLFWSDWSGTWSRPVGRNFPEEFATWVAALPPDVTVRASPELAGFFEGPLRATIDFSALPVEGGRDWFDLTIAYRVEDSKLTPAEIALLLKARGKWVRLPKSGWKRLEVATPEAGGTTAATLDRLGLTADDVVESGNETTHRVHALQLAAESAALESRDARLAAELRGRLSEVTASPPPPPPAGLAAKLRPYQIEGYQFLAHLSGQGFGGVLADDMGLGKTVQTLAWLLRLADEAKSGGFRALVVCPKSVTHGWLAETARFAPSLGAAAFDPASASPESKAPECEILVANYTQLRLNAGWFKAKAWDVVVLDEGQFIKNPTSQVAAAARALAARHRLVLTGTPIENRLGDLWSLFAFAQPGLLGSQSSFRRQFNERDPSALGRLHRRVRHFLLRRTKAQAAPDLPPRTENEIVVDLEPEQRRLYDAELKRARAQLLGVETDRALDRVRFNILASLLRLRQICCHPALVDAAHAGLPSAKLDALIERLEELREEDHQVLVFSQFVGMLELIRERLEQAGIGHLMLTGATEDRQQLVEQFQTDNSRTVFLLSLKAAGFGLNLTAASYAVLYDPWWNPAVEAQAIDRTHRIGQTKPVFAYRLLAAGTIEQKIRVLQQEKAALAAAVVQEESLASVLDLESLRRILA